MRRLSTALGCAFSVAAVMIAPDASAAPPTCTHTAPRTTQCQTTGGSTQIVTSPQPRNYNSYPWYGYGWGLSFGRGGGGISIGGRR